MKLGPRTGMKLKEDRNLHDAYLTPVPVVTAFLRALAAVDRSWMDRSCRILIPGAGGAPSYPMSYYKGLRQFGSKADITTLDIRDDSPAEIHHDYFKWHPHERYDWAFMNPPFSLATPFILKALTEADNVATMARLTFLTSLSRRTLFGEEADRPTHAFVYARQWSAVGTKAADPGGRMHLVWLDSLRRRGRWVRTEVIYDRVRTP